MDEVSSNPELLPSDTKVPIAPKLAKKKSGFSARFLLFLGIIILCLGICLYFLSTKLFLSREKPHDLVMNDTIPPQVSLTPTLTPAPHLVVNTLNLSIASSSPAIVDGSVYLTVGSNKQVFIDKNANGNYNFALYGQSYPIEFDTAELSPDKSKMLLQANTGLTDPILIYLPMSKPSNSYEIGPSTDVLWSPNSRYIAYTSGAGDCGPQNNDLWIFDTKLNKNVDLRNWDNYPTGTPQIDMMLYDELHWLSDSSALLVRYKGYKNAGCGGKQVFVKEGTLTIPVGNK